LKSELVKGAARATETIKLGRASLNQTPEPFHLEALTDAGSVVATLEKARQQLLDALSSRKLGGLRYFVRASFPNSQTSSVLFEAGRKGFKIETKVAEEALGAANMVSERLSLVDVVRIDLTIRTEPDGARIEITTDDPNDEPYVIETNSKVSLYRGLYAVSITKDGYKRKAARLNLIDEDGDLFQCSLIPVSSSDTSDACPALKKTH